MWLSNIYLYIYIYPSHGLSAGAVENADSVPLQKGKKPFSNEYLEYDPKLHLMVRLLFWNFREYAIIPKSTLTRSGITGYGLIYRWNKIDQSFTVCLKIDVTP